jgi:hypothetical protein
VVRVCASRATGHTQVDPLALHSHMALCTAINTPVFSLGEYCLVMLVAVVARRSVIALFRLCASGAVFCVVKCMIGGTLMIREMPSITNTGVDEVLSCGWFDDEGVW